MMDYEPILGNMAFTGVRDFYKTRELVNIIRSRMPNGKNKNFFGKIMTQPKTKFSVGIYLRCKDPLHEKESEALRCKFKVFFRKYPDGVFRIRKDSELTSFICTCKGEIYVMKKDDFDQYDDVIAEVNRADKNLVAVSSFPLIKIPQIKDKRTRSETASNGTKTSSKKEVDQKQNSPVADKKDLKDKKDSKESVKYPLRSARSRRYAEIDSENASSSEDESGNENGHESGHNLRHSRAPAPQLKKVKQSADIKPSVKKEKDEKVASISANNAVTSKRLKSKRSDGLDYGPICKRISFKADGDAKSQELREAANKEFLKLGVDKSFTFKLGVGRLKEGFTSDNLYLRCQRKFGYNPSCEFKACIKRDKETDIWTVSTDSSYTNFICKCEDYGNNSNAIIDILSRKAPNSVESKKYRKVKVEDKLDTAVVKLESKICKSASNDTELLSKQSLEGKTLLSPSDEEKDIDLNAANKTSLLVNKKRPQSAEKLPSISLATVCKKLSISFEKKLKMVSSDIHPIIRKAFLEQNVDRRFSLVFMNNGKLPDIIIAKFQSDVEDANEYSKYFGNPCKISICFQRDLKTYRRFNVNFQNVETNFDCCCRTCVKSKPSSGNLSNEVHSEIFTAGKTTDKKRVSGAVEKKADGHEHLIMPVENFKHESFMSTHDAATCDQCSRFNTLSDSVNSLLDMKLRSVYNVFE